MTVVQGVGQRRKREWSWSFSKLKNYENCPKRMNEVDLLKNYTDTNEHTQWGNEVHTAMAECLKVARPLPETMAEYQIWIDRIRQADEACPGSILLVEQQMALTRTLGKASKWFGDDVWVRMIADVIRLDPPVALVLDWKTGNMPKTHEQNDSIQLALTAQAVFSYYSDITHVRTEYVWLKEQCTTAEIFTRPEVAAMWLNLLPRVQAMELAAAQQNYPPRPSGKCKWCKVASCPYFGKAS